MEIYYINRYSDTNEPDKQGQWARKVMAGKLCIAWISGLQNENGVLKYHSNLHFPTNGNDMPTIGKFHESLEDAQAFIESEFLLFINYINNQ